jgi:cyclic pyranopterin phosphate synthase
MNSLVDSFGRQHTYLRISVTDRCNLRCGYCMPSEGIQTKSRDEILTFDEIERVARLFASMGVSKIRLTGGEPLVRKSLTNLVRQLSSIPERFEQIALRSHYDEVLSGIEAALEAGFAPIKLNTVVMGGVNADELVDFVEFARTKPIHLRFIEYMPFKSNAWNAATFVPFAQMLTTLREFYELIPLSNDNPSNVAKEFQIPGMIGTVGFVTSMSDHFCSGCNRIRLMADGSVKSCLFRVPEVSLRSALRGGATDEILAALVRTALVLKPFAHAPVEELAEMGTQSMIEIGG